MGVRSSMLRISLLACMVLTGVVSDAFALTVCYDGRTKGALGAMDGGHMARFKGFVDLARRRDADLTLVSCGSVLGPSTVSRLDQGRAAVKLMNDCRFDAMAVGPHDFFAGLDSLLERSREAAFPFIATNLTARPSVVASAADLSSLKPFVTLRRGDRTILLFGVMCPTIAHDWPEWDSRLGITDPVEALARWRLEAEKADLVIVLSNMSFRDNFLLLDRLEWVDALITNSMTPDEVFFGKSLDFGLKDGRRIFWTQTEEQTPGLAELRPAGPGWDCASVRLTDKELPAPDADFQARIELLEKDAAAALAKPVGALSPSEASAPVVTLLDALRAEVNAEVAVVQTNVFHTEGFHGNLDELTVRNVFPYPDRVALYPIIGTTLQTLWKRRDNPLIQSHGLSFVGIAEEKGRLFVNGRPLVPGDVYRVATTEFLALGGFGLLERRPGVVFSEHCADLLVRHFRKTAEERARQLRHLVRKPVNKTSVAVQGSFNHLRFNREAGRYQYSDPQATYAGSDIPGFVGKEHIQKAAQVNVETSSLTPGAEWLGRFKASYGEFRKFRTADSWNLTLRYRKTSRQPRWLPFAEANYAGTLLDPDIAGRKKPLFGKAVAGMSWKRDDRLQLFLGLGRIIRYSAPGRPGNTGVHAGVEVRETLVRDVELTGQASWFRASPSGDVETFDGNASVRFPILRRLSAVVRYSFFGWDDEMVGAPALRTETFTGLSYDFDLRRF